MSRIGLNCLFLPSANSLAENALVWKIAAKNISMLIMKFCRSMDCSDESRSNLVMITNRHACQNEKKITALMQMNFRNGW